MVIHLVCAARPNFMKVAPLYHALRKENWAEPIIVHTGQHYDLNMSDAFFEDLGLPNPDFYLGVKSGTHAEQTGKVMMSYEKILNEQKPDLVVVVGDVNSTMAATIAASKMGIKVAHLEAGLRSFDRSMPEEINRVITDHISQLHFCPTQSAVDNLRKEGITNGVHLVGDVMLDILLYFDNIQRNTNILSKLEKTTFQYCLLTLHRQENTDNLERLTTIFSALGEINDHSFIFPCHPRTLNMIYKNKIILPDNIIRIEPVSYPEMLVMQKNAKKR